MEMKLAAAIRDGLSHAQGELDRTQPRLEARVHSMIDTARFTVERSEPALAAAMSHALHRAGHRLASDVARLDALSPLRVLQRGYAIATNEDGRALLDAGDVRPGARIDVRLHHGTLSATVDSTDKRR